VITIDGRPVEPKGTLLDACRAAGATVRSFCKDDRLSAGGHCRSCLVEADGRLVAACCTPAKEGANVITDSPALAEYRRDLGELMRTESDPRGRVGAVLAEWGVTGERYRRSDRAGHRDASHPYLRLDLDACILCRRCIRACEEIQGRFVYAIEGRGVSSHLAWGAARFADSDCVSCGACVSTCPTGAIADLDRARETALPAAARAVRTTCGYCGVGCQLEVTVRDEPGGARIGHIDGADSPVNHRHLCVKGRYAHGFVRHPERLHAPLVRRGGRLVEASWDEALTLVARELNARRGAIAGLSSSRCTNEENYLFQKWLRGGLGTHDVDCCARVCHAPTAAGMRESFGTGAATNSLADIEHSDLLLLIGSNATEAHPVTGARILQAVLRGVGLVVIDPRKTELARHADIHLQLRPGTNVPLLNSLACVMVEESLVDRGFVDARTEGWSAFERHVRKFAPETMASITGVDATLVREAARRYARAARPMCMHGLGVTEHLQGSEAVMLIANLALLAGAIGREGVGVNPLRGQNNVQGAADMGCQPDLLTGYLPPDDPGVRERFERVWGRPLPTRPGRRLPAMWEAARRRELKAMVLFGEDVLQTDPDANAVRAALESLEFLVVQELFLSETAKLAHVVLPGASFLEKDGTFTNGERRVQRVRQTVSPVEGARPDWRIIRDLMTATGWSQGYQHPSEIMDEIARVAPAMFGGMSYARLEGDGLQWPVPTADHPGSPILHRDSFPRGRGALACVDYVPSPELGRGLTLVTGRLLEHYNCGTMTRRTPNLAIVSEERLEMNPADARSRGIADGEMVRVKNERGDVRVRARVTAAVEPGTLFMTFHFPATATNTLTSDVRDRMSDCPEYKVTAVEVTRVG